VKNSMSSCHGVTVFCDPDQDDAPICIGCDEECEVIVDDPDYDERGRRRQFLRGEKGGRR